MLYLANGIPEYWALGIDAAWSTRQVRCCRTTLLYRWPGGSRRGPAPGWRGFLEPMLRIRFGVEGRNLGITRLPIEGDRFRQRAIRLELHTRGAGAPRMILQLGQKPSTNPEASSRW